MPIEILMPALSPTMEEGTLAKWHKAEGDTIEAGDIIAEIETDKATMEVEAVDEGTLGRILIEEGAEGVKVNTVIALLLEDGEDASALDGYKAAAPAAVATEAAPAAAPAVAAEEGGDVTTAPPPAPAAAPAPPAGDGAKPTGRIFASPLAKRMAKQAGLDLGSIAGSGPKGRVVKADVEAAISGKTGAPAGAPAAAPAVAPAAAPATGPVIRGPESWEEVPHNTVRKVIARRLTEAARDVPHIYLTVDCEIDALLAARKQINAAAGDAYKVSVNDLAIKASAVALRRVPGVNAQWTETATRMLSTVDISVAVAYEGGLITPIIWDADRKGLARISEEMKELAGRAREGKLMPEEFQGGGFTVSNLGMYGISNFTSIVNPPQACILSVGAGEQRALVTDGDVRIAMVMSVTLACDHRVVDGALGAQWLQAFKGLIEAPATMLA